MKAPEGRGGGQPSQPLGFWDIRGVGQAEAHGAGQGGGPGAEPRALTSSFSSRCRSHSCSYMRFPTPVLSRVEMICSCVSLLSMMLYSSIKHRICRDRDERHHRLGPRAGLLRKGWGGPTLSLSREPHAPVEGRCRGALRSEVLSSPRPLHDAGGSPAPAPPPCHRHAWQHLANSAQHNVAGPGGWGSLRDRPPSLPSAFQLLDALPANR